MATIHRSSQIRRNPRSSIREVAESLTGGLLGHYDSGTVAVRSLGSSGRRPLLDDLDKAIIKALQLDGRRPYAQIGRELKVPEATVRQRAERLISRRVVQIVGVTDPLAMGFQQPALIGLKVDAGRLEEISRQIAALDE